VVLKENRERRAAEAENMVTSRDAHVHLFPRTIAPPASKLVSQTSTRATARKGEKYVYILKEGHA
jgi:hypothetical protein